MFSEQIWSQAMSNITQKKMTPEQATNEIAERIKAIFASYKMG